MSDNTTLPGTGDVVRDIDKGGKKTQIFGLDVGGAGAEQLVTGAVPVGGVSTIVTMTPTLSVVTVFASGDFVGTSSTAITFASCARVSGGTGKITGAILIDYALQSQPMELWLFDTAVTPPLCNAAWTISDADSATCLGVIPFAAYYASALNSVAPVGNLSIPFKCAAQALYGCLVTRGAPTYASGDLTLRLIIDQD